MMFKCVFIYITPIGIPEDTLYLLYTVIKCLIMIITIYIHKVENDICCDYAAVRQ